MARITAADSTERMPPEGEPLSSAQIALFRQWISQGAAAPSDERPEEDPHDHWAFRRPVRPALPHGDDPEWNLHPIDRLIAREHAREGLVPRPLAEKAILLRRVHLDLVGLPPTPENLRAFLADDSPDAYERVVDQLLDSPQYGERWARHWMDVWRYSDWFGRRMVPDVWNSAPQIWRWRDWIIRSLNEDQSYARMIQEMLAADEIAPDDPEASVATGYLIRNWYALNPNDWMRSNVEHTAKAFLGLTYNCAHCHDHKYDPISQHDYFAMRAFFEPIGIRQDRIPGETDPGPFQEYSYGVLRKIVRVGQVSIYDKSPETPTWFYAGGDERNRENERGPIKPGLPEIFETEEFAVEPVSLPPAAYYPGAREEIAETIRREHEQAVTTRQQELTSAREAAHKAMAELREQLAVAGDALATNPSEPPTHDEIIQKLASVRRALQVQELTLAAAEQKRIVAQAELASVQARIAADRARFHDPPADEAAALATAAAQVEHDAQIKSCRAAVAEQERVLAVAESRPSDDAKRQTEIDAATKKLDELRMAAAEAQGAEGGSTYTPLGPVYVEQSTGRRKALAEWIGSRENPLTARVAINHIWMRHFHAPLVSSVYDFGRNGAAPTHPELLDWLAVEFMDSGWSMKHIHRLIVTSRTYRLASSQGADGLNAARDPENRLLWRMNVGRMEAEVVRDSLLFCGGRL
ncbi:MAG: DUF1549 domain-containing protein, partial [Planctomycetaceae bacterium]|nr:DUF1549 domain-containing protein [Planctomycetaceae bacterium]